MNPIFKNGPSAPHRLILVLFCSVALMVLDNKFNHFESIRSYLQSLVSPLQYVANAPKQLLTWTSENFVTQQQLLVENKEYQSKEIFYQEQGMQLHILQNENDRLRQLLASPLKTELRKMVAEIISVDSDPYSHQVVINRGANSGVFEGQAVLDDQGVVGQVLHVGATSSRILLITDITHAIPVRNSRNGIRMVASGSGKIDRLTLNHVPHSVDIKIGDVLVTSGLGAKYPESYPVGVVKSIDQDESRPFAQVYLEPVAKIDRLRYLLLLSRNADTEHNIAPTLESKLNKITDNKKNEVEAVNAVE